ncbi:MAG: NADH-quinone oxidoreductase subunit J [Gemmataceae bacterium]|nr:NADH-quinone oxidoreductase subunit J [Gemmataceae bacterium]
MLHLMAQTSDLTYPWHILIPLLIAAVSLYVLLPRPQHRPVFLGSIVGIAALIAALALLSRSETAPWPEQVLFYIFSALAILGAAIMLTQRKPARAAISFALVISNVCGLFLLLGAPFLMAATLIVYAGAIIVTFLFVLMLAQPQGFSDADDRSREPFLATVAGFVLLGLLLWVIERGNPDVQPLRDLVQQTEQAAAQPDSNGMLRELGDKREFVQRWQTLEQQWRGRPEAAAMDVAIVNVEEELNPNQPDAELLRARLRELAEVGRRIESAAQPKPLPAANVAGIGTLLYSRYLLAVEVGGTLLLIATVGAIAITGQGSRRRVS